MRKKVWKKTVALGLCASIFFCQPAFAATNSAKKDIYGPKGYLATAKKEYATKSITASTQSTTNSQGRTRYGAYVNAHVYLHDSSSGKRWTKDYSNTRAANSTKVAEVGVDVTQSVNKYTTIIACSTYHYVVKDGTKYSTSL